MRSTTTKAHVTKTGRHVGGVPFSKSGVAHMLSNPVYAGMIEAVDKSVGSVVAKIDALGIAEKTLIDTVKKLQQAEG